MKTRSSLITSALFLLLPACGPSVSMPGADGSGSGTGTNATDGGTDDGNTDSPQPLMCSLDGVVYDEGDEVETPDGCVTFACASGSLVPTQDNRISVEGDLALSTQVQVDAQACLSVVEGSLTISGTAADLTVLAQLNRIGGSLNVVGSQAVTLQGLGALGEVGQAVVIADNASLTTMAFQPYMSVFGDVTIQNNDQLASLAGAEFIGQCGACAAVDEDPDVAVPPMGAADDAADGPDGDRAPEPGGSDGAGDGEPQGGTFYGNILIADNDSLTDIFAMNNLYFAWADVRFRNNASLASLAVLQLSEVQGEFEIRDHVAMDSVQAQNFADGIDVWGATTVCGNLGGLDCPE